MYFTGLLVASFFLPSFVSYGNVKIYRFCFYPRISGTPLEIIKKSYTYTPAIALSWTKQVLIVVNKLHDAIERQGAGLLFVSNRFALGQTGNKFFFGGIRITEILTNFSLGGKFFVF